MHCHIKKAATAAAAATAAVAVAATRLSTDLCATPIRARPA